MKTILKELKEFKVKGIKEGFGHDGRGLLCNIYFNNKKIYSIQDDGWGGETEYTFVSDKIREEFILLAKERNLREIMYADAWNFLESANDISIGNVIDEVTDSLINQKNNEKICKKAIVFSPEKGKQLQFSWSGVKDLKELIIRNQDKLMLKNTYKEALNDSYDNQVLNSDEQLRSLGLIE